MHLKDDSKPNQHVEYSFNIYFFSGQDKLMFSGESFSRPVFRQLFPQLSFFRTFLNKPVLGDLKVKSEIYLNLLVLYKQVTEILNLSSDTCAARAL